MEFPKLIPGVFLQRDNRFRATVEVQGARAWAHVPNSGGLRDLFVKGRRIWLSPAEGPGRKTAYDLRLVELDSGLVSVDARLPNALFAEGLATGQFSGFDYPEIEKEVTVGRSRLDFRLSGPEGVCWVETKSVTMVENRVGLFPDVPTERGRKHLGALLERREAGERAVLVFVIQRADARWMAPNHLVDPAFAEALLAAMDRGVEVKAYRCQVTLESIYIAGEVRVGLPAD